MDIMPNLCAKVIAQSNCNGSDVNSDLDSSDVDFDSDGQNKPAAIVVSASAGVTVTIAPPKNDACGKLTKLYLARVSTDSNETDCSIDFKTQLNNDLLNSNLMHDAAAALMDSKSESSMDCDTIKKIPNTFCMVQNLVSSTDDIKRQVDNESTQVAAAIDNNTKASEFMGKCGTSDVCVSVADVADTNVTMAEVATMPAANST